MKRRYDHLLSGFAFDFGILGKKLTLECLTGPRRHPRDYIRCRLPRKAFGGYVHHHLSRTILSNQPDPFEYNTLTIELNTDNETAEDNMNVQLKDITVTARDGRVSHLDQVYIRGSHVRFFIVPDMLRYVPATAK